ncbi:hypothetical protein HHK36_023841 [Tetracentron sinense]|uniref:tetraacyldisaccharide 4'-kinase n=1 Tax=Tetracentron sinense TaxID=13715 RepID=A0A834YTX9_TETSI|nr:hypothetical protein HHK36_023841 [Tetracentron sinense]
MMSDGGRSPEIGANDGDRMDWGFEKEERKRLPVPVVSVGNLTWGGNGKTPMVEFIALWFSKAGISPLILTRGYAGEDEAKMLQRHLHGVSAKIGIGANRAATAACFFERYGFMDPRSSVCLEKLCHDQRVETGSNLDKISAVIMDDGMQHWSLCRNLEIVMVNGMMPWGNSQLLPLGPLREPLTALGRADVAVIHHADLVSNKDLKDIELRMQAVKETLPVFFTRLVPSHFFEVENHYSKLPLRVVCNMVVLCVSAIGFSNAFVQGIEKDIEMTRERLRKLHDEFGAKPIVVVTEKDYDRDPIILKELAPFKVLVLCSQLQIMPSRGRTEECFKKLLKEILEIKLSERYAQVRVAPDELTCVQWCICRRVRLLHNGSYSTEEPPLSKGDQKSMVNSL